MEEVSGERHRRVTDGPLNETRICGAVARRQHLLGLSQRSDHAETGRVVGRWRPYQGLVYFYFLLDALSSHSPGGTRA